MVHLAEADPLHPRPTADSTPPPPVDAASADAAPRRPRLLVVEDEPIVALDLQRRINGFGYDVAGVAADGDRAIQLVRQLAPDLVLMDIGIQGQTDGVEAAVALQRIAAIPVIFVTGNADPATVLRAQTAHPFNYIVKPIRDRELKISIDAALHHHRLATELRESRDLLEQRVRERTAELEQANARLQTQIAEQFRLERQLRLAQAETDAASRSKSRFFANISHEIRTPMSGIVGMAEVLASSPLDGDQCDCCRTIQRCAGLLLRTIDEIIEFAELESGGIRLNPVDVDPRTLLPAVLRSLELEARDAGVELTCDIAPEVPSRIQADPDRLGHVLRHLVGFCLGNTHPTDIEVQCEHLAEASERAQLHFSIRDTSAGLSPEMQKRVQRVFTQSDAAFREVEGLGLGLTIPSLLVRLMGGILWLETIPGLGNTFHCVLWGPSPPENGFARLDG